MHTEEIKILNSLLVFIVDYLISNDSDKIDQETREMLRDTCKKTTKLLKQYKGECDEDTKLVEKPGTGTTRC